MGILWSLLAIEDSVIVEYGPAGTTHFSMSLFGELGVDQQNRLFNTHMIEDDVVMGDVSRLEKSLVEVDQGYRPRVIFVVASSVSAVIGTDLQGVCAYMQEKVDARLIAFEQGGFRGDYSAGIQAAYRLLAEDVAEADVPRNAGTYNILGASAGSFRMESDVREIERLMREAFGMELNACLCLDTSVEKIQRMGCAEINLAVRGSRPRRPDPKPEMRHALPDGRALRLCRNARLAGEDRAATRTRGRPRSARSAEKTCCGSHAVSYVRYDAQSRQAAGRDLWRRAHGRGTWQVHGRAGLPRCNEDQPSQPAAL